MANTVQLVLILIAFIAGLSALMIYIINAPFLHGLVVLLALCAVLFFTPRGD